MCHPALDTGKVAMLQVRVQNMCSTTARKHAFQAITFFCVYHTSEHMFHGSFTKSYEILVSIQGVCSHFQWQKAQFDQCINILCKYCVPVYNFIFLRCWG